MLKYSVTTIRIDSNGSEASAKSAKILLDTKLEGRVDAFNPAELLLAAISACIIKGVERVAPMLNFKFKSLEIHLTGERQDSPPKMNKIEYEIIIDSDEDDHRLDLLHENIKKYGTVYNTVAPGTNLLGTIKRR